MAFLSVIGIGDVMPDAGGFDLLFAKENAAMLGEIELVSPVAPIEAEAGHLVLRMGAVGEHAGGAIRIERVELDPRHHGAGGVAAGEAGICCRDDLAVVRKAIGPAARAIGHPGGAVDSRRASVSAVVGDDAVLRLVEGIM